MKHGKSIEVEPDEDEEDVWLASFKSVWLWFERQQLVIANRICAEASAAILKAKTERKATEADSSKFGAVSNVFVPKKKAEDFTIDSARDLLYYVAEIRGGGDPRNYSFGASQDQAVFPIEAKWRAGKMEEDESLSTHELYTKTNVSKYKDLAAAVNYLPKKAEEDKKRKRREDEEDERRVKKGLEPKRRKTEDNLGDQSQENQARKVIRLLKGTPTTNDSKYAVPDTTLALVAAIWGVSEASRASNSLGNVFVTLFLLKKKIISWSQAAGDHKYRYLPSGSQVGYDLQRLLKAIVDKNVDETTIPPDLITFAKPYQDSLARFIATASITRDGSTYEFGKRKVLVKKVEIRAGYLEVKAKKKEDAQGMLAAIMYFKILRHLEGNHA